MQCSTSIYADLDYADAAEMQRKSPLATEIARIIKARRLTQDGAAALLGTDHSTLLPVDALQPTGG